MSAKVEVCYYWDYAAKKVGEVFTIKAPLEMKPVAGLSDESNWGIFGLVDPARKSAEVERRFVMLGYACEVSLEEDEELRFVGMVNPPPKKGCYPHPYALFELVKTT
jgi:hypothetical protein